MVRGEKIISMLLGFDVSKTNIDQEIKKAIPIDVGKFTQTQEKQAIV